MSDKLPTMPWDILGQRLDAAEARNAELEARVGEMEAALDIALDRMKGVTIFVNSKERIKQPEGRDWFDEGIVAARQALSGSPAPVRETERAVVDAAMGFHQKGDGVNTGLLFEVLLEACDAYAKLRETGGE